MRLLIIQTLDIRDSLSMAINMVLALNSSVMVHVIKGSFEIIRYMVMEYGLINNIYFRVFLNILYF